MKTAERSIDPLYRRDSVWVCLFLTAGLALSSACAAESDEAQAWAQCFGGVKVGALTPADRYGVIIRRIGKASPAERIGLRAGDIIVGADGIRTYDLYEYFLVLYCYRRAADDLNLVLRRGDRFLTIRAPSLLPLRRLGVELTTERPAIPEIFQRAGVKQTPTLISALDSLPTRVTATLAQAISEGRKAGAPPPWLIPFLELWEHLRNRRYEKAAAVKIPGQLPLPTLARAARFYQSLAERHKAGERAPDPGSHGEPLPYYVSMYPFPATKTFEFGNLKLTDAKFQTLLKAYNQNPAGSLEERKKALNVFVGQSDTDHFLGQVKRALLHPESQGGWPYRSSLIYDDRARRLKIMEEIESRMKKENADYPLYACALIGPLVHEQRDEMAIQMIRKVREASPYIAYRMSIFMWQSFITIRPRASNPLMAYLAKEPFSTIPGGKSGFLEYLESHWPPTPLPELYPFGKGIYFRTNPIEVYFALRSPSSTRERLTAISASIQKMLRGKGVTNQNRDALTDEIADLYSLAIRQESCDFPRILANAHGQPVRLGKWLDTTLRCFSNGMWKVPNWVPHWSHQMSKPLFFKNELESYRALQDWKGKVDWQVRDKVPDKARAFYFRHGGLCTTLGLADILEEKGFPGGAQFYRRRITDFTHLLASLHATSERYVEKNELIRMRVGWVYLTGLIALSASPATAKRASAYGEYYFKITRKRELRDTAFLHLARAYLEQGDLNRAADNMIASLTARSAPEEEYTFFAAPNVIRSPHDYRAWILKRIVQHKACTAKLRKKLADSDITELMPEEAKALLGVDTDPSQKTEHEGK